MTGLSVTAQMSTTDPPSRAFERLEAGQLLDFDCHRLTPGSAVSVRLPVGDDAPGHAGAPITLLGHVAAVKHSRSVVVVHHQPWRGRLVVRFLPEGSGTRIVLECSLDNDGVAWLAHKRGYDPPEPSRADRHRIGLLVSKSGPAAVFAQATETLADLAIDDVNADGGIAGVPVELLIGDDASNSVTGTTAALRLMKSGCRAIFACVTSATFRAASSALHGTSPLLIHTVLNEGGPPRSNVVRLGERPLEQVRAGIPALMKETGSRTWFLVGHRYSWSYGAHWAARRVVSESGGTVLGDRYLPLGTLDFTEVIEDIEKSGAELIVSSLVGQDEVHFERQCFRHGLRSRTRTLALVLDEATRQLVGGAESDGVWAAFGYFHGFDDRHRALESRYDDVASGPAPPLSSLSETTYEAIVAYARAASVATVGDQSAIRERLISGTSHGYPAPVRKPILLAESQQGRYLTR